MTCRLRCRFPNGVSRELASLAQSINTMAGTLARSKGLERQFLLSVSHDLRTPLTSIRGFAEAIADGAAPDNARAAEVIAAEARRLERLVKDLLDLAKFGPAIRPRRPPGQPGRTGRRHGRGFRPAAKKLALRLDLEPAHRAPSWPAPTPNGWPRWWRT